MDAAGNGCQLNASHSVNTRAAHEQIGPLSTGTLLQSGFEVETCSSRNPGPLDVVQASGRYRATAEYNPALLNDLSEAFGYGISSTSEAGIPHPHMGLEEPQLTHVSHAEGSNRSDLHHNVA